jgi:hypothetical protein
MSQPCICDAWERTAGAGICLVPDLLLFKPLKRNYILISIFKHKAERKVKKEGSRDK